MSVIETLQHLSHDDDDDDDTSDRRPTPLDPEYWRGITHSLDAAPHPQGFASPLAAPSLQDAYGYVSPLHAGGGNYAPQMQMYQRPVTAPGHMSGGGGAYGGGSAFAASPINFHGVARPLPISPMTHSDRMMHSYGGKPMMHSYAGGFGDVYDGGSFAHGHQGFAQAEQGEWGHLAARGGYASVGGISIGSMTPQALKAELRNAFVRAQAFLDLVPFFQSCDHTYSGGIPLRALQEGLLGVGVTLSTAVLQSIGQLFSIPGSGLVDYTAFSRFLELDGQEMYVLLRAALLSYCLLLPFGMK